MILCVETNKRASTDNVYILDTLRYLYGIDTDNSIHVSIVYMGSKSKYKAKEVLKEIDQKTKDFAIGETRVIYCIDTDQYEINVKHEKELKDISQFCKDKGYDLIWFCHDIEEVFLGKKIPDSQKVQEAFAFRRKKLIKEIPLIKLSGKEKKANTSNMLNVFDKYLSRKQGKERQ